MIRNRLGITSLAIIILVCGCIDTTENEKVNLLINSGFEEGIGEPSGWFKAMVPAEGLVMSWDENVSHTGKKCVSVSNDLDEEQAFNYWAQDIEGIPIGGEVELSGWIKTENVSGGALLAVECWGVDYQFLAANETQAVAGTADWNIYRTSITIPEGTTTITVRAGLEGTGKALFDDVQLLVGRGTTEVAKTKRYNYAIVVDDSLYSTVKPLAEWKEEKGLEVITANISWISSTYDGYDLSEQIRNFIVDAYNKWGIEYVLLAGDAGTIPPRYIYLDPKESESLLNPSPLNVPYEPTDDYYACLEGTWDADGDHIYGEGADKCELGIDEVDWTPEVWVGRLPADDPEKMSIMINKVINYEKNPPSNSWSNRVLWAAPCFHYPDDDTLGAIHQVRGDFPNTINHTLLSDSYSSNIHTLTKENFTEHFNRGYTIVNWIGHGDIDRLITAGPDGMVPIINTADALKLTNGNKLSLVFGDACLSACFDSMEKGLGYDSLGEALLYSSNGGAICYIGSPRVDCTAIYDFYKYFFSEGGRRCGPSLYMAKENMAKSVGTENYQMRKLCLITCLLGDPELQIAVNKAPESLAREEKTRGIAVGSDWVGDEAPVNEIIDFIDECDINMLIVDFGWITWSWNNTRFDAVGELIERAQNMGIPTWLMYRARTLPGEYTDLPHQINKTGKAMDRYICFTYEECRNWSLAWADKLLEMYPGVDGFMLYNPCIFSDCCYCDECINKFRADTGINQDPREFQPGTPRYDSWLRWRSDQITQFVEEWVDHIKGMKSESDIKVGAVLLPPDGALSQGQNLRDLASILDVISPFVCLDGDSIDKELAEKICNSTKQATGGTKIIADIKIYGPYNNTDKDIANAMKSALNSNGDGFFIWCFDCLDPAKYNLELIKQAYQQ